MIKYYIEKKNIGKKWDDFVKSHPRANSFQMAMFFDFYEQTNEFQPFLCMAQDRNNKILGGFLFVIQKKGKSFPDRFFRRALILGGPLIPTNGERVLEGLLIAYNDFVKRKVIYSEIRNMHSWSHQVDVFLRNGFKYEAHLNYQIPLNNRDVVAAFSKSKRRQIRKGLQSGALIVENPDINQVRQFYEILVKLYNERVNKPLPDWSFFKSFQENIGTKNAGKYLLVHFEGKIVGGIMLPFYEKKMVYEWYVAGLDKKYKSAYPSVLATWAGIDYAIGNDFVGFDFMGAGIPTQTYGVREFKSKFGGRLLNYGRFTNSHAKFIHLIAKVFIKLFSKKS